LDIDERRRENNNPVTRKLRLVSSAVRLYSEGRGRLLVRIP